MTAGPSRRALIARAFALEWFSIAWMVVEAAVALVSGVAAHSITLIAFGADSIIELLSACVLVWRLDVEARKGLAFSRSAEERARKLSAVLLFALAAYVIVSAGWSLWTREGETFSPLGLAVVVVAIPAMYLLARAKFRIAEMLPSRALRADAVETLTCGYLSAVVVVGLLANVLTKAWWVDAVTSLGIVVFLVREAREAWSGDECCQAT